VTLMVQWSGALLDRAKERRGLEAAVLLENAEARAKQAETLAPGRGAMILARLAAYRGHRRLAREWLATATAHGALPDRKSLGADPDLQSLRKEPWFAALLGKAKA
jgi:hypothetical protein